ncbi:hypothetical protein ONS96_008520 [Cadophora gregata f. sp. sojae]|nr:hypothetical protein ONS96_008520 [Cadophora gregata f. sp. sojae]
MGQTLCCIHPRPKPTSEMKPEIYVEDIHWSNVITKVEEKRHKVLSGRISRAETLVDASSKSVLHNSPRMEHPYRVSESQLAFFEEKGYLIIKDSLSATETRQLQTWVQEVHDLPRTMDCSYIPYEEVNTSGQRVLCRTENFANTHQGFGTLLRGKMLSGILEQLNGNEMLLFKEKSMFHNKPKLRTPTTLTYSSQFQVCRLRWFPTSHRSNRLWRL